MKNLLKLFGCDEDDFKISETHIDLWTKDYSLANFLFKKHGGKIYHKTLTIGREIFHWRVKRDGF